MAIATCIELEVSGHRDNETIRKIRIKQQGDLRVTSTEAPYIEVASEGDTLQKENHSRF